MTIEGIQTSSNAYSTNQTNTKDNTLGKDGFMKILSAQLQYQDPMSGGDNTEFIAQMAQFSALEQMENLNNSFAEMMRRQDLLLGSQWIGKEVAVFEEDGSVISGIATGFMVVDNEVLLHVNDKEYKLDQVAAVAGVYNVTGEDNQTTEDNSENQSELAPEQI